MRTFILLALVAATGGQRIRADHLQALEAAKASGARIPAWAIAKARRNHQLAQAAARRAGEAKAAAAALHENETLAREAPLVAEFSTDACATARPHRPHGLTPRGARLVFEAARGAKRYFEWGGGGGAENFPRAMAAAEKVVSVDYHRCGDESGTCFAVERRCMAIDVDLVDDHPAKWRADAADDSEFDAFLPYTRAIRGDERYDVVLVAGRFRVACLLEAHPFVATGGTVFLQNAQRYLALHYSRNQLATPRRWLPHVTASYTLNAAGKRRIGKRNNAVLRRYYDVVAMTPDVVALRPKPSTNATWEEDLAAARRDPC
jgi:hypothetical protein